MTDRVAWLIDTNVVSEMMRPNPEPRVAAFPDQIADEGIGIASITVWEILNGIGRLDAGHRRAHLADRFQDLLGDLFEDRIVDWTSDHARACARIMEHKRRRGEPLDDHLPDAFLAATAPHLGLAVVTRNTSQFHNTGVEVPNPWSRG